MYLISTLLAERAVQDDGPESLRQDFLVPLFVIAVQLRAGTSEVNQL